MARPINRCALLNRFILSFFLSRLPLPCSGMKPNPTKFSAYIAYHCHQGLQTVLFRSQQLSTSSTAVEHIINTRERDRKSRRSHPQSSSSAAAPTQSVVIIQGGNRSLGSLPCILIPCRDVCCGAILRSATIPFVRIYVLLIHPES